KLMNNQKLLFEDKNKSIIKEDAMREEIEEKELLESSGVGLRYQCVVCRSREKEDEMGLVAFITVSFLFLFFFFFKQ
ncbi:hypothetical protein RFI_12620, partial [Reticulomyxa filosa]